jgi:predicted transcriptional regulator
MDVHVQHALTASLVLPRADLRFLTLLADAGPLTAARLAEAGEVNQSYAVVRLAWLERAGLVVRTQVATRPGALLVRPGWMISPDINLGLERLADQFSMTAEPMVAR